MAASLPTNSRQILGRYLLINASVITLPHITYAKERRWLHTSLLINYCAASAIGFGSRNRVHFLTTKRPKGPRWRGEKSSKPIFFPASSTRARTSFSLNIDSSTSTVNVSDQSSTRGRWQMLRPRVEGLTMLRLSTSHFFVLREQIRSSTIRPAGTSDDFIVVNLFLPTL